MPKVDSTESLAFQIEMELKAVGRCVECHTLFFRKMWHCNTCGRHWRITRKACRRCKIAGANRASPTTARISSTEAGLLAQIPGGRRRDWFPCLILADWLEETGRPNDAEAWRWIAGRKKWPHADQSYYCNSNTPTREVRRIDAILDAAPTRRKAHAMCKQFPHYFIPCSVTFNWYKYDPRRKEKAWHCLPKNLYDRCHESEGGTRSRNAMFRSELSALIALVTAYTQDKVSAPLPW